MKIKEDKVEDFQKGLEMNKDPYGGAVYTYLQRWADMMEAEIEKSDNTPEEVIIQNADRLSRKADVEGITGFMYAAAVGILSEAWEYGEILKNWHNEKYSYHGEGVVNPNIIEIKK